VPLLLGPRRHRWSPWVRPKAITATQVDTVLGAADNSGATTVVVHAADDSGTIGSYIQSEIGNYNATNYIAAQYGGGQLAALLAST